ncbi:hypothetical protein ACWGI8_43415, partial [Streptomyces sp. NPDC054841]
PIRTPGGGGPCEHSLDRRRFLTATPLTATALTATALTAEAAALPGGPPRGVGDARRGPALRRGVQLAAVHADEAA